MSTLLFEIGCEELPAAACREAERQLPDLVGRHVGGEGDLRVFVGPRRLAVLVEGMTDREPDRVERNRGPRESAAFDEEGRPTRAVEGFARGNGVSVKELERAEGFVWAVKHVEGKALADVLPSALADIVRGLSFSKSMRWDSSALRFSRPIRWLCAKLDDRTIEVELEGVPSEGVSYGHRFTEPSIDSAPSMPWSITPASLLPSPSSTTQTRTSGKCHRQISTALSV